MVRSNPLCHPVPTLEKQQNKGTLNLLTDFLCFHLQMTAGVDFIITDNASQANDRVSITQTIRTPLTTQTQ